MADTCLMNNVFVTQQNASRPPPLDLGINVEKPKFPQYAVYSKRLESFESWPAYLPVQAVDLAEAGLVYTGVGDSVRCYFCGGGLRNWDDEDVPMEEHAKWYPKCAHILLTKGRAYIEKLVRGEKPEEDGAPSVQIDSAGTRENHLESVAALSCLEMDFPKEMVKKSIDVYIGKYGKSDFKAKDLCEILFDLEENPEEQSPCATTDNVVDCITTIKEETEDENTVTEPLETLIEENQRLKENQMCKICLDKKADVIFLPCGHMVSCPQCAPALPKCPICRKTVNGQIKAFFAVTTKPS